MIPGKVRVEFTSVPSHGSGSKVDTRKAELLPVDYLDVNAASTETHASKMRLPRNAV
jgi:hypothetical protein